ncbi:MAG TPA: proton-conducting transporter membrane subunit [Candidatus Acidoferrales bacterium]|nr:proton-conducting transporter membrane subunit [Candidatus Acidoferrales bacterium]
MEAVNLTAFAVVLCLAAALGVQVVQSGPVSLWDGFFYADALSALVVLLSAFIALICSIYAVGYFRQDERDGVFQADGEVIGALGAYKLRKFYSLTPVFVFAMVLVALANNLGMLWVAIEATTLTSVFLVTFYGTKTSLEAAWKYIMIGGVGLSMALFGTFLTYYSAHRIPGTETLAGLNWSVLAVNATQLDKPTMRLAFILILMGYGTKAGLAPMHTWKPDAYGEAPVPAAAIFSSALLNCALYALVRFYILANRCLGADYPGHLLLLFGMLSMGISVPFILVQRNFRRLLAYHTIDHAGIMVTALGVGGPLGALGLTLHMTFHTVAKSLLFLCAGSVYQHFKTDLFHKVKGGVIHVMPLTGTVFLMAILAIIGMPPFSLFQSEFVILRAAMAAGHYVPSVLFVVFSTGIFAGALVHVGGLILAPADAAPVVRWQPWRNLPLLILSAILVVIAFWIPPPLFRLIQGAAVIVASGPVVSAR